MGLLDTQIWQRQTQLGASHSGSEMKACACSAGIISGTGVRRWTVLVNLPYLTPLTLGHQLQEPERVLTTPQAVPFSSSSSRLQTRHLSFQLGDISAKRLRLPRQIPDALFINCALASKLRSHCFFAALKL